tara:strand:+ start:297 stop:635 length:339 start_codon:yes stop_codon:yes gene_type:complete
MDNDLIDMIAAEEPSATDVHDKIKDLLYAKSAENIETIKPAVTASMFGGPNPYLDAQETETETEVEPTDEVEPVASDEAPGTPSSVEEPDVEQPTAEVETPDNDVEEEKPEA